jgi:fatty acid desaturase
MRLHSKLLPPDTCLAVMNTRINHLAVWILVVVDQLIGGLWYHILFGNRWLAYHGKIMTDIDQDKAGVAPFVVSIAAAIAINYTIAWLIGRLSATNAVSGLKIALICWFAFLLMPYATIEAFSAFGRNPVEIVLINMGHNLVLFALAGVVLGAWRRGGTTSVSSH